MSPRQAARRSEPGRGAGPASLPRKASRPAASGPSAPRRAGRKSRTQAGTSTRAKSPLPPPLSPFPERPAGVSAAPPAGSLCILRTSGSVRSSTARAARRTPDTGKREDSPPSPGQSTPGRSGWAQDPAGSPPARSIAGSYRSPGHRCGSGTSATGRAERALGVFSRRPLPSQNPKSRTIR